MRADPVATRESQDGGTIEASLGAEVDVLDAGVHAEAGGLQQAGEPPIAVRRLLAFWQEGEAVLEPEGREIGDPALLLQGLCHPLQAERPEAGERLFNQQGEVGEMGEMGGEERPAFHLARRSRPWGDSRARDDSTLGHGCGRASRAIGGAAPARRGRRRCR